MTPSLTGLPYSFSMMNLLKLMPEWSWDRFDQVMAQAGTNQVELVPSMLLGMDWDQVIEDEKGAAQQVLERLMKHYKVSSIQSLTYGLQMNLADPLIEHHELLRRLQGLKVLGNITRCSVLILGSPGQKKRLSPATSNTVHKKRFVENCGWMASTLGPGLILSLEHNTKEQGAEYCNTLGEIIEVVKTLRRIGVPNVGINLDTKCLIHEFGNDFSLCDLFHSNSDLVDLITSIQVSYDFLTRSAIHHAEDFSYLVTIAGTLHLPLSLEEFGLVEEQIYPYAKEWISRSA